MRHLIDWVMRHSIKLADTAANLKTNMVFFFACNLWRHPCGMAKSSRLGAKGSFVIRERKVKSFYCVSSQALRLLYYYASCTVLYCTKIRYSTVHLWGTTEPERFGKVRPLGSKGSNPLQGHAGVCMYPCVFHVLRALATTEKRCVIPAGAQARAYLHEEACTVARHPHPS